MIATAAGLLIANLYLAQPLLMDIARDVSVSPKLAGGMVGMTQAGYGLGLLLIVPLSDLVENRRLVISGMGLALGALLAMSFAQGALQVIIAALALGIGCSVAQVLIPFISHLVEPKHRNRIVGNVMAGILVGVTIARPMSLMVSALLGWRAVFVVSAALLAGAGAVLIRWLPLRLPSGQTSYFALLRSLPRVAKDHPPLMKRALCQACVFCSFTMFWATYPEILWKAFLLDRYGVALLALAGASGAMAAPFAARMADRGWLRCGTVTASASLAILWLTTIWAVETQSLIVFAMLAVLIDGGVMVGQTFGRLVTLAVDTDQRGRANSLYMTTLFAGGAVGSLLGTVSLHTGGWQRTAVLGSALCTVASLLSVTDLRASVAKSRRLINRRRSERSS